VPFTDWWAALSHIGGVNIPDIKENQPIKAVVTEKVTAAPAAMPVKRLFLQSML
jgi:hypothetical protein